MLCCQEDFKHVFCIFSGNANENSFTAPLLDLLRNSETPQVQQPGSDFRFRDELLAHFSSVKAFDKFAKGCEMNHMGDYSQQNAQVSMKICNAEKK